MIVKIQSTKNNSLLTAMQEECLLEMELYGMYTPATLQEAAKFSFLPRIKQRPELKKLWKSCEEAEDILNDKGMEPSDKTLHKLGKLALRIYSILIDIWSVLYLPSCLLILPIPVYLLNRLWQYVIQIGEDAVAKSYTNECIKSLEKLKKKSKDKKANEKIDKQIEKLKKLLKDY